MKYVHATLLILFLGAVLIFAVQNHEATKVAFLNLSFSAPLAVLMVLVYLLGMVSGWSVFEFVRRTLYELRERRRTELRK
jgi:uncharacterized integral membrane protein